MDQFEELNRAKERINQFFRSSGSVSGDASGVMNAIRADIDAYIQRKIRQAEQP